MSGERVVVAMSGGVDSSVAAACIVGRGDEAIGVTMHLAGAQSRCCSLEDADDARRVADRLGMRFYVANYKERFQREVIQSFADAYLAGRTPIPCVACNQQFKFDYLLERAKVFGAERVASGHYARVDQDPETGLRRLRTAVYLPKDQSYFLFGLTQDQLEAVEFPLGEMTKEDVRARARELGLGTAEKPESQEICFVPDGDYAAVVEKIRPEALPGQGEIVDEAGAVLGHHPGIHHFTVGQRKGLGLGGGEKRYVTRIDAERNRVVVGSADALDVDEARVEFVHWIAGDAPPAGTRARVRVRYRHEGAEAILEPDGDTARVRFDAPVRAITPGQAAVFYQGDVVLGGGWIAATTAGVSDTDSTVDRLGRALGHAFVDAGRAERALSHPSFSHETAAGDRGNERLEFLGDAVLDLVVGEALYHAHPDWPEGRLTRARAAWVRRESLADRARELGLPELVRLGRTELLSGGADKDSILANTLEAVVGALYLDAGLAPVERLVRGWLDAEADGRGAGGRDAKTAFQEWAHARFRETPSYHTVTDSGVEADEQRFTVEVRISGEAWGAGTARSKRLAERAAAEAALVRADSA